MTGGFYRWVGAAFAVLVAVGIGVAAYQAGVMHGLALQIPAGTTLPVVPYGWHYRPWGFGFGPFFFILLWFLLIRGVFWGGHRGWHYRRWDARRAVALRRVAPARARADEGRSLVADGRMIVTTQYLRELRDLCGSSTVKTVLVVDDERQIAAIASDYLRHAGFSVLTAGDGVEALALARSRRPDLVVLDLGLPRLDGLEVARTLRKDGNVPIIMLTARVDESDRLLGLELGADDYISKPFSPRELVARVRAVLRRADAGAAAGAIFRRGDLTIDVPRQQVTRGEKPIDLTPTEFQLLATLARQPGRIFTRAQLLDAVRGSDVDSFERAIDTHIKNIRRKLETDARSPRYLLTVYGIGYKFGEP